MIREYTPKNPEVAVTYISEEEATKIWIKYDVTLDKELLSKQEVSDMTGLALKTLGQRRWRKQLPTYVIVPVSNRQPEVFYHADSVKQFIEMRQKKSQKREEINSTKNRLKELTQKYKDHRNKINEESLKVQIPVTSSIEDDECPLYPLPERNKYPFPDPISPFEALENRINELEKSFEERNDKFKNYMYKKNSEFHKYFHSSEISLKQTMSSYNQLIEAIRKDNASFQELLDHKLTIHKRNMYDYVDERVIEFENPLNKHKDLMQKQIDEIYENVTSPTVIQLPSQPIRMQDILKSISEYQKRLLIPLAGLEFSYRIKSKLNQFYSTDYKYSKDYGYARPVKTPHPLVYIGDLVTQTDMDILVFPNWGRKTLKEFKEILQPYGYELETKLPAWWNTENMKQIKELSDLYMKTRND
jgi:hypothetical protein